jgi:deazaflavin-dependent oxidoreductase (nitroreductase family)
MSSEFNQSVIAEFRARQGSVGGDLAGMPIILIHHIGARTGAERVTPLTYSSQADGRLLIAASNGGSPTHPAWYHNLKANPTIEVELGAETFTALAEELTGPARDELWPSLLATWPALAVLQAKTGRRIALLTLTRRAPVASCRGAYARRCGAAHQPGVVVAK